MHWSPIKQLRKGTGMKQKRMMRKTVPLITPWDSGLQTKEGNRNWAREKVEIFPLKSTITASNHSHFLLDCLVEVHPVQPGWDEVLLEGRDELQGGQAAQGWHQAVDDQRHHRHRRHALSHVAGSDRVPGSEVQAIIWRFPPSMKQLHWGANMTYRSCRTEHTSGYWSGRKQRVQEQRRVLTSSFITGFLRYYLYTTWLPS